MMKRNKTEIYLRQPIFEVDDSDVGLLLILWVDVQQLHTVIVGLVDAESKFIG